MRLYDRIDHKTQLKKNLYTWDATAMKTRSTSYVLLILNGHK